MSQPTSLLRAALLVAAAAALALAASQLRSKHQQAEDVTQSIKDQLDALDPVTRASVVTRLTANEIKNARAN